MACQPVRALGHNVVSKDICLELKSYGLSDCDLEVWRPSSPEEVFFVLDMEIGELGDAAVTAVRSMHGEHSIPTLLKRVDELARTSLG